MNRQPTSDLSFAVVVVAEQDFLLSLQEGSEILFTIRATDVAQAQQKKPDITAIGVSYDAFVDDIQVRTTRSPFQAPSQTVTAPL